MGTDLFELQGTKYLLVVDYISRYPEVTKLSSTTSRSIITALKCIFSRHGIPSILMSDNGPQFSSNEMMEFTYAFTHVTSSPRYPQSNGLAEKTVKTVKEMVQKSTEPYKVLLSYRATSFPWCNLSPAELLMGCRVCTHVPQLASQLVPQWHYLQDFCDKEAKFKEN